MGILGSKQAIDERIAAMPGIMGHPDPSPFEGAISATFGGFASGIDKFESMFQAATSSFGSGEIDPATGQWLTRTQVVERDAQAQREGFRVHANPSTGVQALKDWGFLDAANTGIVGRTAHGVTEGLTVAGLGSVFGPWGAAALMGPTFGYAGYKEAKAAGEDTTTAAEMGTLQGVVSAAGAFIPMKFGSALNDIASGAGINVALGGAQRFASAKILEHHGYSLMASQYRVWDAQAMGADVVLGTAFGWWGHLALPAERNSISPADVDAASAVAAEQMVNHSAPGTITDPAIANLHVSALQKAVSDVLHGRTPDIDPETAQRVVEGVLPDEANLPDADAIHAAAREHLGVAYDAAVADILAQKVHEPSRQPSQSRTATQNPLTAGLDPFSAEQLTHLVEAYGDASYVDENGNLTTIAEAARAMQAERTQARADKRLFDVAAACAARNL